MTPSGGVQNGKFPLGSSLFNAVAEDVSRNGGDGPTQQDDAKEKERNREKQRGKN